MTRNNNPSFESENVINITGDVPNKLNGIEMNEIDIPPNAEDKPEEQNCIKIILKEYSATIKILSYTILHVIVGVYFAYATYYFINSENENAARQGDDGHCHGKCGFQWCNGYGLLILLTAFTYFGLFYYYIFKPKIGRNVHKNYISPALESVNLFLRKRTIIIAVICLLLIALCVFLFFETRGAESRLSSIVGPIIFILAGYVFSTERKAIRWRPVLCGITLQFLLGVICIRWEVGRSIFKCMGDKVATYLSYTNEGTKFVFGEEIVRQQIFAFALLPVIFFFSFCISILYYLGAMQWVITKLGWILQQILGTTVCESVNAAANIFLGMSESPLLIRPYIKLLTHSEMHAIMVSGFATVSGTVLAAYMSFGAQPAHLITSSVMAAPASLAISKLYYPETEESLTKSDNIKLEKSKDSSILDAASNGATVAVEIVLGIVANLVAFVAFIAFVNGIINWFGYLVGLDDINFEWIFSKLFIPLCWVMGVPWEECDIVAKVVATKTIINEFVAFQRLGTYKDDLSARSFGIATFAICGFANPSSLGILIGTLGAMAPERKSQITSAAFRAFIVGSIVCFMSASFAGLLMTDEVINGLSSKSIQTNTTS